MKTTQTLSAIEELRLSLAKQHTKRFHLVVGGLVGAVVVLLYKIVNGEYKDGNYSNYLVVVLLLNVGAGLRVTTTCVGAALGLVGSTRVKTSN